jgi:hypothetical protein
MADNHRAALPTQAALAGRSEFADAWWRLLLALNEIATHLVATIAVLASIWLVQNAIQRLSGGSLIFFEGTLLGPFNVEWLFQASDLGIIGVLSVRIVYVFYKVFKG